MQFKQKSHNVPQRSQTAATCTTGPHFTKVKSLNKYTTSQRVVQLVVGSGI